MFMRKVSKCLWAVAVAGFSALISACAGTEVCNNDACYDRQISSVDPYKKGEVAAWGSEKEVFEQEENEYREHKIKSLRGE